MRFYSSWMFIKSPVKMHNEHYVIFQGILSLVAAIFYDACLNNCIEWSFINLFIGCFCVLMCFYVRKSSFKHKWWKCHTLVSNFFSGFSETFLSCISAAGHRTSEYSQSCCSYLYGRPCWHVLDCLSFICELTEIWQQTIRADSGVGVPLANNYIYIYFINK